ncbi:MAG TPA: hypothetical protein VJH68_01260 [Candidatus Nanoarchaeia archaeon]|nr:hypothetical protein [Candidatus Nanoarchaeia archaeon]
MNLFLPTTLEEGQKHYQNFEQFDVVFITGDPYYDHPLSGIAVLSRLLDRQGYKIGIIAQPETDQEYLACDRPKYFFCITSGLLDSMLANYTPMLRKRENVLVPERAIMIYTQKVKQLFREAITILGGVEATIRRFTHFDYKENKLRRGILNDSKADLLLFGNAERPLLELLNRFQEIGYTLGSFAEARDKLNLSTLDGAAFRISKNEVSSKIKLLPGYEECLQDKEQFSRLTRMHYLLPESSFIEPCGQGFIQHNRASLLLTEPEMDLIYGAQFSRKLHPHSKNLAKNQAMVDRLETSVIIGKGCWGSCNFCIIPLVQGKEVAHRSRESILSEIETLYQQGFAKINDLTLPTLNMYGSYCALYDQEEKLFSPIVRGQIIVYNKTKYCNQQCAGCPQRMLRGDLYPLLEEVEKLQQKYPGTELELRSAIRHDLILQQKDLFRKIMQFTSRLKIAPEHISETVLRQMNKSTRAAFEEFLQEYKLINQEQGTNKNLVPYFVAAHPGSTIEDMKLLRQFCNEQDIYVNLTQVFTPTPGTASTATYYTGQDTFTKLPVHVPRTFREKKDQKNILLNEVSKEVAASDEQG